MSPNMQTLPIGHVRHPRATKYRQAIHCTLFDRTTPSVVLVCGSMHSLTARLARVPRISVRSTHVSAPTLQASGMTGSHTYQCVAFWGIVLIGFRRKSCRRGISTHRICHHTHALRYPRPGLTVDAVIVADGRQPEVLLIKRKNDPFAGSWALPGAGRVLYRVASWRDRLGSLSMCRTITSKPHTGGFVDENETLDHAAARELEEETGLSAEQGLMTQVGAFGDPGRDPRGWCVSVAYAALVPANREVQGADDADEAKVSPAPLFLGGWRICPQEGAGIKGTPTLTQCHQVSRHISALCSPHPLLVRAVVAAGSAAKAAGL